MKLYVCYGTFKHAPRPDGKHSCGVAYHALRDAGHDPRSSVPTASASGLASSIRLRAARRSNG